MGAFASSPGQDTTPSDDAGFRRAMTELASAAPEVRAARLRRALGERFDGVERWFDPTAEDLAGWTRLIGPVRCEACGEVRERALSMALTHPYYGEPVLGPGFTGGVLRPGTRVAVATDWRDVDEDRGDFVRLRHPLPPGSPLRGRAWIAGRALRRRRRRRGPGVAEPPRRPLAGCAGGCGSRPCAALLPGTAHGPADRLVSRGPGGGAGLPGAGLADRGLALAVADLGLLGCLRCRVRPGVHEVRGRGVSPAATVPRLSAPVIPCAPTASG